MSDLSDNGVGTPAALQTALWPPQSKEATWLRLQPLLTAEALKSFHLFGISLVGGEPDPETGKKPMMTNDMLELYIERAVELAEGETGLTLMSTLVSENLPFDRQAFESFGYIQLRRRPVWGIQRLTIRTADEQDVYTLPNQWIARGSIYRGLLNIIPLTLAFAGSSIAPGPATGLAGAAFLASLGQYSWIPSYWGCDYYVGFPDGMLPALVNELVGTIAAMEVLSSLAATYAAVTSATISVDSLSESQSGPGNARYLPRLKELADKRKQLVGKLKTTFGQKMTFGTI